MVKGTWEFTLRLGYIRNAQNERRIQMCLRDWKNIDPPPPSRQKPLSGKLSCRCTLRRAQVSAGVGKPRMDSSVHLDAPGQWHGQQPVSGTADSGVVKQDKSSRGPIDTTKARSDPQRVRMCSGEMPIGAAKGKQTNTMASCQPPPPPHFGHPSHRGG